MIDDAQLKRKKAPESSREHSKHSERPALENNTLQRLLEAARRTATSRSNFEASQRPTQISRASVITSISDKSHSIHLVKKKKLTTLVSVPNFFHFVFLLEILALLPPHFFPSSFSFFFCHSNKETLI